VGKKGDQENPYLEKKGLEGKQSRKKKKKKKDRGGGLPRSDAQRVKKARRAKNKQRKCFYTQGIQLRSGKKKAVMRPSG